MELYKYRSFANILVAIALMVCSCETKHETVGNTDTANTDTETRLVTPEPDSLITRTESEILSEPVGRLVGISNVTAHAATSISTEKVTLLIDSGAVSRDVEISILATTEEHSGSIPENLANLTVDGAVYRMLPDGQKFEKDITIAMSYDSTALPYGYTPEDIYTFFYNEETHLWQQVERDSVDTENQIVYSRTNHFTDYINGVLKVPESNDAMAYTPTSIKDLKAADPMEGITMIAPPEANNMGTANLSYPLQIPAGRRGMQPNLAVTYNSAGGSGILGLGWSLPVSEISVETRWGVPLYDRTLETEGYILDGTTLVTSYYDDNHNLRLNKPVYHREYDPRYTSDTVRFYPRVEGAFRKIERIGTNTDNYYWVVTDKDGTKHFYGKNKQATLRDHKNNIAKWMLEKSVDTYGNTVTYTYATQYDTVPGQPSSKQVCLDCIRYTGVDGSSDHGQYIVRFNYVEKQEKTNSFRYGLEETDHYLLDRVEVMFRDTIVREYYFGYKKGDFGKTLLCKIFEGYDDSTRCQRYQASGGNKTIRELSPYSRCGVMPADKNPFLHIFHSFEYYSLGTTELFAGSVTLEHEGEDNFTVFDYLDSIIQENHGFSGSGSSGWNVYGGLNVGSDYTPWLKTLSAGGHYSYSKDQSEGFLQLVDINGDGYPDKLYKTLRGELKCRPQIPGANKFGAPETIHGISSFLHTESSTHNYGWEASATFAGIGENWSDGRSTTSVYVSDINGDGLADIVDNGSVFINRGGYHFSDVTNKDTIHVGGSCESDVFCFSGETDPTIFDDGYYTVERIECKTMQSKISVYDTVFNADGSYVVIDRGSRMSDPIDSCWTIVDTFYYSYPRRYEPRVDLVRMWKAPYTGIISVSGTAKLSDSLHSHRVTTRTLDGVWISVQKAGDTNLMASEMVFPSTPTSIGCQIDVIEGDTIFFRINAHDKRLYDQVEWTPHIEYSSATHRNNVTAFPLTRRDANGDYVYKFDYASDYMLAEHQCVAIGPDSGGNCDNSFSVVCKIKAHHPLSQDMSYSLVKSNIDNTGPETVINSTTFSRGSSPNVTLTWDADVPSTQKLVLRLSPVGGGQLNWSEIDAYATVALTYSTDATINSRLADSNARGAYIYHPAVERAFYDYLVFPSTLVSGISGSPNLDITVTYDDCSFLRSFVYLTVKGNNDSTCFKTGVHLLRGRATVSTSPFVFSPSSVYSVDCYVANPARASHISNIKVTIDSVTYDAGLYAKYGPDTCKHHGTLYRGWGQFGYKCPDSNALYINSNQIHADSYYTDTNNVPRIGDDDIDNYRFSDMDPDGIPEESPGGSMVNPLAGSFFEMHADAGKARWTSFANLVTASRSLASLDNADPAAENGQLTTVDMMQSPLPVVSTGAKVKAVNKLTMNKGTGYTRNRHSHSEGYSRLLGDYMDLNGDRYPDNVSEKVIQFSRAQGGLGSATYGYSESAGINRTENTSDGHANNGTFLVNTFESVANAKKSRVVSRVTGLLQLLSGVDPTIGSDLTKNTFTDINGDGLADLVFSNGTVKYNMGYRFTPARSIPPCVIRSSRSVSFAKGIGINRQNTSITGNIGCNWSGNTTTFALMDVNADGLPDLVSPSLIQINMGDGSFTDYSSVGIDNSTSTSFSLNVSGTYDVVFSIWGFPVKVGGSAGGGASVSFSHSRAEFTDMNNDGYVDYVYRDGTNIKVRYSKIGCANMLKSVTNFANAEFLIEYEQSRSTVECPQRHWNMSVLSVYDGHDGDGASTIYKRFDYGNRHYDRFERDDYGYDTVITYDYATHDDFDTNSVGSRYRTYTQIFFNDTYYQAHQKRSDCVSSGNAYVETRYTYGDADLEDGHYLGGDTPAWCEGDGWPAVSVEETFHNEGSGGTIATRREFTYGSFGNVTYMADHGDVNDPSDDYTVHISYEHDLAKHIVANVSKLDIPGYRHREAKYTDKGSIRELIVRNSPSPQSLYTYKYDQYGNVKRITTPATRLLTDDNYWIDYCYDPLTNTLPVSVSNAEGHSSRVEYSPRWQKPINTYDIAGNRMHYTYDSHGRTDTIIAPKELADNIPYTVKYDYWYSQRLNANSSYLFNYNNGSADYTWSRTRNYDPANPGNDITTVVFCDGLGRVIQTKKDIDEDGIEKRVVGGNVHYDGLGRKTKEFFPVSEPIAYADICFDTNENVAFLTETHYDWLDRPVQVNYPDGTTSANAYSLAPDANSVIRYLTDVTDQNNNTSHIFSDSRQLNIQLVDALGGTTSFHYDAIGQLIETVDPENNTTRYLYDQGGRCTDRLHPSSGHTRWDYDAAGSMIIQRQNSGARIDYTYDYMKLVSIGYSDRPWNNVWYEYGRAGDGNNSGRLVRMQDATGTQSFEHDNMGNVVHNVHTYVQPQSLNTFSLETGWEYDSWGRVCSITYPDQEVVTYSYDHGGNVFRIAGHKPGLPASVYIDTVLYDCFGQRIYQKYGNGVATRYQYDPGSRRLSHLWDNSTQTGMTLQSNTYKYDNVGNILQIDDNGLNIRSQSFEYDNINRLISSVGTMGVQDISLGYETGYSYSRAGRLLSKNVTSQRLNTTAGVYTMDYQNRYSYDPTSNPFAIKSVLDTVAGNTTYFGWDANGNMVRSHCGSTGNDRWLCWTEDNRLQGYMEHSGPNGDRSAWYNYNADGERNFKLTTPSLNIQQNAATILDIANLRYPTLYASALITFTRSGYTKHYFEGANRVCSKIGGGFQNVAWSQIESRVPYLNADYEQQSQNQLESIVRTFGECIGIGVAMEDAIDLYDVISQAADFNESEPAFFYQSDHLGSVAYMTNDNGQVTQTLNYLPYGEDWVDIQHYMGTRYSNMELYTFTGKEKDSESGYHYFSARYYDSELLTGWLSVDPMMDKYPSISPYAYCIWSPIKLVDSDGEEVEYASFSDRIIVAVERVFRSEFRIRFYDLKKSSETYVFKGYFNREKNGGEVTTNGEKIFINYNKAYKKDQGTGRLAHLRHETEHAVQFEYGEVGFDKGSSSTWECSTINFDITDETKARDFGYSIGPLGLLQSSKHERTFRDDWLNPDIPFDEKIAHLQRTYCLEPKAISNSNNQRIKNESQYMLPYRERDERYDK